MSRYRRALTHGGTYFFTVNLADRKSSLLIDQIEILRTAYAKTQAAHPFETISICILPNHIHALWQLPNDDNNYSLRWQLIKRYFSRELDVQADRSASKILKREKGIWQRRFWEHQILNESDLLQHIEYIHNNPVKHGLVTKVQDWEFSSYHRILK